MAERPPRGDAVPHHTDPVATGSDAPPRDATAGDTSAGDTPAGETARGSTLWHGRFGSDPAESLWAFTVSLPFDQRLWAVDLEGSRAHAAGLGRAGLLTGVELASINDGLERIHDEFAGGSFEFVPSDEDIHTAIERRLTELAGPAGAKLHTARSRNDQVATDVRLWCKAELPRVAARVLTLQRVLAERAAGATGVYLPGYTHLQRAQPVMLAHHLLAHGWALGRDVDRLMATVERLSVSPLGAGALAGTSLPIDPATTAGELGFDRVFANSLDAVSDRDFVAEAIFDLALVGVHLSRIGEEWVLWTSDEFGFATLDDGYATGSSMLPQKKNPDIAELARGKAGRLIGHVTAILTTLKGLPLAYNRDLQEDKEPLFDAVDQVSRALDAVAGMIATATFRHDRMAAAADGEVMAATDLAEHLVRSGMPFRQAHAAVGELVRNHLATGASLAELAARDDRFGADAASLVQPGAAVANRRSPGGGGPTPLRAQMAAYEELLAAEANRLGGFR